MVEVLIEAYLAGELSLESFCEIFNSLMMRG